MAGSYARTKKDKRFAPRMSVKRVVRRAIPHLFLIPASLVMIFPLVWMVSTSLKPQQTLFTMPPELIPNPIRWENYTEALTMMPFHIFFRNSVIYCVGILIGQILVSALVGYGFARLRFPGREVIFWLALMRLVPEQFFLIKPILLH